MANKNVTIKRWNISTWDVVYPKTTIANVTNLSTTLADLSSDITDVENQLNGKEPSFSKNTAFNKNFGSTAGTVTEGNDARLSNARAPLSHTHGNITNDGKIGSIADLVVVTGTNGVLTTQSRTGIDNRTSFPPSTHNHDDRYYTETEIRSTTIEMRNLKVNSDGTPTANLGSPTIAEMALFQEQFNNKTAFYNQSYVYYEISTDGVTWTTLSVSETDKKKLFGGDADSNVVIPNGTAYFRIRVRATSYVYLNALYAYMSWSGHKTKVHVYKKHDNDTDWTAVATSNNEVSGWPGHLYLPFSTVAFHPSAVQGSSQVHEISVVFIPIWDASYPSNNIIIYRFQLWGGYPADKRTIYSVNGDKEVTFPKLVTAPQFSSTIGTGYAPFTISSTTLVTNLNADLLDGQHGSYYQPASTAITTTNIGSQTVDKANKLTTARLFTVTDNDGTNSQVASSSFDGSSAYTIKLPSTIKASITGTASGNLTSSSSLSASNLSGRVTLNNLPTALAGLVLKGNGTNSPVWGTVAWDEVSSKPEVTSSNTASTIVLRDSLGNFSAGTITATLSGNATTVTNGVYTDTTQSITGLKTFTDLKLLNNANTGQLRLRSINTDDLLERILSIKTNNANRSLTISGDATISGTNTGDQTTITGNAGTATTLQTARTLTIGSTGKTFNGGADVTWSLAEIGAASSSSLSSHTSSTNNPHSVTASQVGLGTTSTPTFASVTLGSGSETWSIDDTTPNTLSFKIGGNAKATLTNTGVLTATTFVGALTGTASGNLTSSSSLDASKLSGAISTSVTQSNWDAAFATVADIMNGDVAVGEAMYADTASVANNIDSTNTNTGYTGAYSMWIGTQAQYNAIVTKSNTTIYYVI